MWATNEFQILADLDQKRRHMSEHVFYPDTDDVSRTSKVVALSIARNRTRELILSASTIQFAPDESAVADDPPINVAIARHVSGCAF